jgi:hypothetical protein
MMADQDLHSLVGTPIMSAISILSSMGFRCTDITRQVIHTLPNAAGTFSCKAIQSLGAETKNLDILLSFSDKGIVMDVSKIEQPIHPPSP